MPLVDCVFWNKENTNEIRDTTSARLSSIEVQGITKVLLGVEFGWSSNGSNIFIYAPKHSRVGRIQLCIATTSCHSVWICLLV